MLRTLAECLNSLYSKGWAIKSILFRVILNSIIWISNKLINLIIFIFLGVRWFGLYLFAQHTYCIDFLKKRLLLRQLIQFILNFKKILSHSSDLVSETFFNFIFLLDSFAFHLNENQRNHWLRGNLFNRNLIYEESSDALSWQIFMQQVLARNTTTFEFVLSSFM